VIIFTGNFLTEAKLKQPVTILHAFDENTRRSVCSVHERDFVEKFLGSTLDFKNYSRQGYIKYYKPSAEQEERIATLPCTLSIRYVERIPENNALLFHKEAPIEGLDVD
jgi:hypothetical protein